MAEWENDWIFEDSEEEDQPSSSQIDGHLLPESTVSSQVSSSSTKTFTSSILAEESSNISSVGTNVSTRSTISSFPPPPPVDFSTISEFSSKSPRPIFSRTAADPAPSASVTISDCILPHVPGSAGDHGDQFAILSHSDHTVTRETTQNIDPDVNNFPPDVAERANTRARIATKRSSPHAGVLDVTRDFTDDELAVTPTRKPKEMVEPRLIKCATPVRNNPQQLNSEPVTVPMPSSSSLSHPSAEGIVINSPPPHPHVEAAAPDSPSQESTKQPRKRKRTVRLHSPVESLPDPKSPPAVPDRVTSPRSNFLPLSEGVVDVVDLGHNLNSKKKSSEGGYEMTETPKKRKTSKSAEKSPAARPESSRVDKSKKKTIVKVIIMSPRTRRTEFKKAKAKKKNSRNPEGNDAESRNDHPPSSPSHAEQSHRPVDDRNVHASRQRRSDSDDEMILAPKRRPSSKVNLWKGKQKARESPPVDSDTLSEISSSNEQVATCEEEGEEPRNDEHHAEGSNTRANEENNSRSCAAEPESPAPLLEKTKHNDSSQEVDSSKPSTTRETPPRGELQYSPSRSNRRTSMQELIRRASSYPNAPFSTPVSPSSLAKTSKSTLRRIPPLHLTRRTPPPPPPRPPPPKKSKKMLELEEKWEMELEDEVVGWCALTDGERQYWRRTKRNKELGCDD